MNPSRWRVRSLRRFSPNELWVYGYGAVGGLLSLIYFVSALWETRLIPYMLQHQALPQLDLMVRVMGHVLFGSILRAVLWLPQLVNDVLLGKQTFIGWLLGRYALEGMV